MNSLYLFGRIAGTPVAIRASEVEAVVRMGALSPTPGVARHVVGLAALRSRVLTIIDVAMLVAPEDACATARPFGIVCDLSGHSYGMLVDEVTDICEVEGDPLPVRGRIGESWRKYVEGVVMHDGVTHLLVSLSAFVDMTIMGQAA